VYNIINNKNNSNINNLRLGTSSPNGADIPNPDSNPKIEKEISRDEAELIVNPQWVSPTLLLTSTGKYFRVKD